MVNVLSAREVSKSFDSTQALRAVSLSIAEGERVAILGANGAGKSTLMKVFAGVEKPDSGTLELNNQLYAPRTPTEAISKGVSTVYQEPNFFPHLTVMENLFIGKNMFSRYGIINFNKLNHRAIELLKTVYLDEKILKQKMRDLSLAEQQLILIARAVQQKASVLILDEPTSILTNTESENLFSIVNKLSISGTSICYITHRFDELDKVADRFIIMRDGEISGELDKPDKNKILNFMGTGFSNLNVVHTQKEKLYNSKISNEATLKINQLDSKGNFGEINFEVYPTQILGLYGLVGSGRSEIAKAIIGEIKITSGKIFFKNDEFIPKSAKKSIEKGIVYLPEDRKTQGIFQFLTIRENITVSILNKLLDFGIINKKKEVKKCKESIDEYSIKTTNIDNLITSLSGGNQQKVLISRLLTSKPKLLILDEPTRGIDVRTKNEIHEKIKEIAQSGTAIILITSELPELIELCNDVIVLHEGKIVKVFNEDSLIEKEVLSAATALTL